jgi:hypothetical protein
MFCIIRSTICRHVTIFHHCFFLPFFPSAHRVLFAGLSTDGVRHLFQRRVFDTQCNHRDFLGYHLRLISESFSESCETRGACLELRSISLPLSQTFGEWEIRTQDLRGPKLIRDSCSVCVGISKVRFVTSLDLTFRTLEVRL